jgi:hypothetical protein
VSITAVASHSPVIRLHRHKSMTRKSEHPRAKAEIPLSVTCPHHPKLSDCSALQCLASAYTYQPIDQSGKTEGQKRNSKNAESLDWYDLLWYMAKDQLFNHVWKPTYLQNCICSSIITLPEIQVSQVVAFLYQSQKSSLGNARAATQIQFLQHGASIC